MAKTKNGPALFELIHRTPHVAPRIIKLPRESTDGGPRGHDPGSDSFEETGLRTGPDPARNVPLLQIVEGHLRLSLGSISGALVVFLLAASGVGLYEWGTRTGFRSGLASIVESSTPTANGGADHEWDFLRNQDPATDVVKELLAEPAASGRASTATAAGSRSGFLPDSLWVRGLTYVVVQEFLPRNQNDVEAVRAFLAGERITTETVGLPNGGKQIIATLGFDLKHDGQRHEAEELLARIRECGTRYYAQGGGYKLDGYFKTLRTDSWVK